MGKIKKVLVANRGEIALRIFKSLKELSIETVAVFSDADRGALHVRYADQAVYIGPSPASQSYLQIDKILDAARVTGADAIHPGYGFLSEKEDFARAVREAGLTYIGPSEHSIQTMGSKLEAKRAAQAFGVPLVPGTAAPITDTQEAIRLANEIGFPILIKASAGGGGHIRTGAGQPARAGSRQRCRVLRPAQIRQRVADALYRLPCAIAAGVLSRAGYQYR
ncbi:MAG: biotin carboxylase N-terminal domain-containing protein, partial [Cyclobacteriaceae bacterium]